ncbi:MAG: ATP-binding protein [Sporichthyaceae bacterium]|nr:ATP-binding protein [Sporichthyaceae bacterium]
MNDLVVLQRVAAGLERTPHPHGDRSADSLGVHLVPSPDSVPRARRMVRTMLTGRCDADVIDAAELVTSELVTNAIRHTSPGQTVRLAATVKVDGTFRVEVTDSSDTAPPYAIAEDDDEGGRGLYLVRAIATRFGWRPVSGGKALWAEFAPGSVERWTPP